MFFLNCFYRHNSYTESAKHRIIYLIENSDGLIRGERTLAQFVKLKDYLSRYEKDPLYYSSEFPRLKRQFWQATCTRWVERDRSEMPIFDINIEEEVSFFRKLKEKLNPFQWRRRAFMSDLEDELEETPLYIIPDEVIQSIKSERDLKQVYLDELLKIQLRWVSSGESIYTGRLSKRYLYDERLRYFIQKFPDHYFYFHDPIFKIKKAPVELSSILLAPAAIYCISYMDRREESVLIGSREKFWVEKYKDQEIKVLNPLFHLRRSSSIVRTLIRENDFPIYKVILCPNSYVDYDDLSSDTIVVDARVYDEWMQKMRTFPAPVKFSQIRVLQNLLSYTAIRKNKKVEVGPEGVIGSAEDEVSTHEILEQLQASTEKTDEPLILNYQEVEALEQQIEDATLLQAFVGKEKPAKHFRRGKKNE